MSVAIAISLPIHSAAAIAGETFEIWPSDLPSGAFEFTESQIAELQSEEDGEHIRYVERPTMMSFLPAADRANGCAVIICPGGGYNVLSWPKEGTKVAEWFNSIGVTAFVLKYRVPRRGEAIHREPLQDLQRTIRLVRQDAERWRIDPNRVGVLGFSAGGHLAVMAATHFDTDSYTAIDAADQLSARPDFVCPIYVAYLADGYKDDVAELGPLVKVTRQTPPMFMTVTWDDKMRGAQSALLFAKLREHGVRAELHAFTAGGHGYGLNKTEHAVSEWPQHLERWLSSEGWLSPAKKRGDN